MSDFLPAGFDLNDVLFYSTLVLAIGYAAMGWRQRRDLRDQRAESLSLEALNAVARSGNGTQARPASRVGA